MDVSGVGTTGAATATGTAPGTAGTSSAPGSATADPLAAVQLQQSFLQLLVAQLQYQNPLQPMDGTQWVTQLAQFSMLSELEQIRQKLDQIAAAQQQGGSGTAAQGGSQP
ncbi:MAG: flagellar hook capping FlgD N-terminal domain-containing protein [Bacillota bacterium]|nr:flagellar hook capping FlgD N-terminal domain-containing protein [Bacillota bacterium]